MEPGSGLDVFEDWKGADARWRAVHGHVGDGESPWTTTHVERRPCDDTRKVCASGLELGGMSSYAAFRRSTTWRKRTTVCTPQQDHRLRRMAAKSPRPTPGAAL